MIKDVRIEAFCHPTEDLEKVKEAFMNISPVDPEIKRVTTHFHTNMFVLSAVITRRAGISKVVSRIKELPSSDRVELLNTVDDRLDSDGNFFIRISKFSALDGKIELSDGEPIEIVLKFVEFPSNIEKVKDEIRGMLCDSTIC